MMNQRMQDAILQQINKELYSAYLYLAMSAFFETKGLKGAANWMKVQSQEELFHANKFFTYIADCGGQFVFPEISAVPMNWQTILDVYESALKHEKMVTDSINNLMSIAIEERDFATQNVLQWFIAEQVEEEKNADEIIQKLRLIGHDTSGLFLLDTELATRVYVPPTTGGAAASLV